MVYFVFNIFSEYFIYANFDRGNKKAKNKVFFFIYQIHRTGKFLNLFVNQGYKKIDAFSGNDIENNDP